jgi:hypothetical protein
VIIKREYNRSEEDDFKLNVQKLPHNYNEALPLYREGQLTGWKIQSRYE